MQHAEILDNGQAVSLRLESGERLRFHAIWLRDNAWDEATRAAGNGQRLITVGDIPRDTRILKAAIDGNTLTLMFTPENKAIATTMINTHNGFFEKADKSGHSIGAAKATTDAKADKTGHENPPPVPAAAKIAR